MVGLTAIRHAVFTRATQGEVVYSFHSAVTWRNDVHFELGANLKLNRSRDILSEVRAASERVW
jgi:hypothetical protein